MTLGFELGLIVAFALSVTATLSDLLHVPKKLRSWVAMCLIVGLYMVNQWLYAPGFQWKTALLEGVAAGLASVGIHSSTKNTIEQWSASRADKNNDSQSAI